MKRIPNQIIKDYAMLSAGFCLFFLLDPFGLDSAISNPALPIGKFMQIVGEGVLIFICAVFSELVTSFVLNLPCDYSKGWSYQIRRKMPLYFFVIIFLSAFIGQYFTIIEWGWSKWFYFWHNPDGSFTLKWYMQNFTSDLSICVFIAVYWVFLTNSRMKEHKIQELLALNDAIDKTEAVPVEKADAVDLVGESKESLTVSPSDIIYIESIANYLSIWYFSDGELKQKRIRNTLKNIEGVLASYPFMLHCHRAFLVNTHFITYVEGNSAGCQLHLFSIDRTIPVSKANIEALRQALL